MEEFDVACLHHPERRVEVFRLKIQLATVGFPVVGRFSAQPLRDDMGRIDLPKRESTLQADVRPEVQGDLHPQQVDVEMLRRRDVANEDHRRVVLYDVCHGCHPPVFP